MAFLSFSNVGPRLGVSVLWQGRQCAVAAFHCSGWLWEVRFIPRSGSTEKQMPGEKEKDRKCRQSKLQSVRRIESYTLSVVGRM